MESKSSFLKAKVSGGVFIICCILVFIATVAISKFSISLHKESIDPVIIDCPVLPERIKLNNFELTQPLLLVDLNTESSTLQPLKMKLLSYIDDAKKNRRAQEVSVYFRRLNDGGWFAINPGQMYYPANMRKIIYLITYLKESETHPDVLNNKILFKNHFPIVNPLNKSDFELKENTMYSVKELLTYMIKYSDHDASVLLRENMNMKVYNQLFYDLKMTPVPPSGPYTITVTEYSKFYRILYNATYLKPEFSEYALELLAQSKTESRLKNGIDSTVIIANKYGVRIIGDKQQLQEFGIVFFKGDPYLIGVITTGNSITQLTGVLEAISKMSFEEFLNIYHS